MGNNIDNITDELSQAIDLNKKYVDEADLPEIEVPVDALKRLYIEARRRGWEI